MVAEISSDDREAVERQVLASLWADKPIRLTARVVDGQYSVSIHSTGDEPDSVSSEVTPRA